jgi:hypothetical protein
VHLEPPGRAPRQLTFAERIALQKHMQAIGGGDINSIYAGLSVQQAQLNAQVTTANNTTVLANKANEQGPAARPTTVAK